MPCSAWPCASTTHYFRQIRVRLLVYCGSGETYCMPLLAVRAKDHLEGPV
jgi:hypothetical protein